MSSTSCRYHPEVPAEFECAGCHKRFCSKCVKEVSGKYYCEVCKSRLRLEGKVQQDRLAHATELIRKVPLGSRPELTQERAVAIFGRGFAGQYRVYKRGDIKGVGVGIRKSRWTGVKVYMRHEQVGQTPGAPSVSAMPTGIPTSLILEPFAPISDTKVVAQVVGTVQLVVGSDRHTARRRLGVSLWPYLWISERIERRFLRKGWSDMVDEVRSFIANTPEFK